MKIRFEYTPEEINASEECMKAFAEAGDGFSEMAAAGIQLIKEMGNYEQKAGTMTIMGHINDEGAEFCYDLDPKAYCAGMHTASAFASTFVEIIEYLKALGTVLQLKIVLKNAKSMFTAVSKSFCGKSPAVDEDEEEA